jgi:putative transposase
VSWACKVVQIPRSTFDYKSNADNGDEELRVSMRDIATKKPRWGLPRIHSKLSRLGLVINIKRTDRIYREEKLQVRNRKRKKRTRLPRVARPKATRPNEVWSIDFVHDWIMTGRKLKCLTIVDDFTKESVGILCGHSISGLMVANFFRLMPILPTRVRSDNGPEFDSAAFTDFAEEFGLDHEFITPGKPNENAYIESFNSRFRDECLNQHVFRSLDDAKIKIEEWRQDYNSEHLHSSLGMLTPNEFAEKWRLSYQTNAS